MTEPQPADTDITADAPAAPDDTELTTDDSAQRDDLPVDPGQS